ncbi:FtsL-like putative cell division protein [Apibacter raozihei]|uniref:FtsL-like putative cell division protein n=1 Tax=Apibacter TaxID=1778601 RepID=UPI000FE41CC8|nr:MULTISPECIES: FtsL-like putative cell division protein [Apibacter]
MARRSKNKNRTRTLSDILRGKFLVEGDAFSAWKFILFIVVLSLISISSSHIVDEKVVEISSLKEKAEEYKARYALIHSKLMKLKVESELENMVIADSLFALDKQPYKILVPKTENE